MGVSVRLLLTLVFAGLVSADEAGRVVLEPGTSSEPLFLDRGEAGTHFVANGVVVLGGESEQFATVPKFCLFSDLSRDPAAGIGYEKTELLEELELPNGERYPAQIRELENPALTGLTVIGMQSRELPWRVIKAMWDGDALHVKGCSGRVEVADVYFENVEDGFGPEPGLDSWSLRNAYMRGIRDDAVENDSLISGEVVNCLIDGCFTFLSQRPDSGKKSGTVTTVIGCVIHVQAQPHDGIPGKAWRDKNIRTGEDGIGRAPGMLFKWGEGTGSVRMRDCVVRIDALSVNGPGDMEFPPGEYSNVTVVWSGEGDYPKALPDGVAVTRNLDVWEEARRGWIAKLGDAHPAKKILE